MLSRHKLDSQKAGTGKGTGKRAVIAVGFHSLRHTYVSLHAERGTPAAMIQNIVGHSNLAMTRHYTHVNTELAPVNSCHISGNIRSYYILIAVRNAI